MSTHSEQFVAHLQGFDRRALAVLRHSLAFAPGSDTRAFPYVERFAGAAVHEHDARRLALYAVAALFARHPQQAGRSFATAFGELLSRRSTPREPNKSIEGRFIALLGADAENIVDYLRQAVSLLSAEDLGFDYARLLDDLSRWLNPRFDPSDLRQRWARDFYRAAQAAFADATNE
ncbi:type I-E CRISPR-associated protein Cse2/CasB [Stutzerimonas kirkiae]|uniref:type I-E CRISPR-associated protein Cse2/CasB n=1 Tax=Stutzerimonas kirkiae TaxID=2211392 RepID=UPI001038377F|nr:type I-E CRISPR-associated protein Cse2/CasB [Stutzerimonas kirkiae]TBV04968.1 type I-E CRISPR-associated protein Cse2/CasB [Stutzerimonas kirkiae]TBV13725.1 type I-E CRISPR-associated protein Cse2/CasB [Stutzerimonas kirkiae]